MRIGLVTRRGGALGLFAAVALFAVGPASAQAAFPGKNGRIAFTRSVLFSRGDIASQFIQTASPTGRRRRTLHTCPRKGCEPEHPTWSPSGRSLAFSSYVIGAGGRFVIRIGVVRSTGTGYRHLPGVPGMDEYYGQGDPAWAPGGRSFAFSAQPEVGTDGTACCPSIYAAQTDRTGLRRLTSPMRTPAAPFPGDDEPAWSPSGEIAFTRDTDHQEFEGVVSGAEAIYVMKPDGSGLRRLTRGYEPDWSPDGRHIAFSRGLNVYIARSDGSGLRRLTRNGGGDPAWSPDGKWIAFAREGDAGTVDLYVVRTNGSRLRRIADGRYSAAEDEAVVYGEPSWQPRR